MWGRSAILVAIFTGLSRMLGLLREMLMSSILGTGYIAEAFIVAFKFPNFFRRFFAEGAFNAAFIPYLAKNIEDRNKAQIISSEVFSLMLFFMIAFVALVEVFASDAVKVIAPGYEGERLDLAIKFTRLTFPYIALISLSAILAGILNSIDRFKAAAFAPLILNFCMIGALVFVYFVKDEFPGTILSLSVTFSGVIQLIWLFLQCYRHNLLPKITFNISHGKMVLKKMVPGMLGAGVTQINIFMDMILASFLEDGSIAYLYYADRLLQLPLSLIGVSLSTIMLPKLSKLYKNEDLIIAAKLQKESIIYGLSLSFVGSIGIFLLAEPIISIIFERGAFHSTHQTSLALMMFSFGLSAHVLNKILSVPFFAVGDTKTPVMLGLISVFCNFILNVILMQFLSYAGLALSTSISAWVLTILLIKNTKIKLDLKKDVLKIILCSMFIGLVIFFIKSNLQSNILQLLISIPVSILLFIAMFFNLKKTI